MTQLSGAHRAQAQPPETSPDIRLRVSSWGVSSLILGIWAAALFVTTGFYGFFALLAVIFGHLARRDIKRGRRWGTGFAVTGLVLGYLILAVSLVATMVSDY